MRIAALGLVSAALALAGAALAIGPPQPPSPDGIATTVPLATSPVPLATLPTGLVGYVSRGPVTPNCDAGDSCFRPVQVTLRFSRQGRLVARAVTRVSGAYRIALRPGVYSVSVAAGLGRLTPSIVRLPVDRWRRVNFTLTTGIY